jgi:hypothetical protein
MMTLAEKREARLLSASAVVLTMMVNSDVDIQERVKMAVDRVFWLEKEISKRLLKESK